MKEEFPNDSASPLQQDSKSVDVNAIHHPDRLPDMADDLEDPYPKLEDQAKTVTTYLLHAQFCVTLS